MEELFACWDPNCDSAFFDSRFLFLGHRQLDNDDHFYASLQLSFRHKLDRAHQHLQACKTEIEAWLAKKPYSFTEQFDADRGFNVVSFKRHEVVPFSISPIIGDCVQNLRSGVDMDAVRRASWWRGKLLVGTRSQTPAYLNWKAISCLN